MGEVVRLAAPVAAPTQRGCSMSDNRRSGYVVCWRSLLQAEWARNATKLAAWMRLIGMAAYEAGPVHYKGRDWHLLRGQLVISATELGMQLRDERGRGLDKKGTERMLAWFAKEDDRAAWYPGDHHRGLPLRRLSGCGAAGGNQLRIVFNRAV